MSERFEQASLDGLDLDEKLADLPLQRTPRVGGDAAEPAAEGARSRGARSGDPGPGPGSRNLDLFDEPVAEPDPDDDELLRSVETPERAGDPDHGPQPRGESAADAPAAGWVPPAPAERLLGGLADVTVHLGVLAAALLAMSSLSLPPSPDLWPGFVVFLLSFSFLYHVVPLAFWGQTPGMAWRGLRARDRGGRPLSFGQSGLRWVGALVTFALLGAPLLLAFGAGGSLSDRATRSATFRRA